MKKICIMGAGTYWCYLAQRLIEEFGENIDITLIDLGNEKIRSEKQAGLVSYSIASSAAKFGRYFGLGGTSAKWGGQILFFDHNDNPRKEVVWDEIISVCEKFRNTVLTKLTGKITDFDSNGGHSGLIFKTGLWLKYSKRNLYKSVLKSKSRKVINILKDLRVVRLVFESETLKRVELCDLKGQRKSIHADIFYLTAGALESCRLLLLENMQSNKISQLLGKNLGDHISLDLFELDGKDTVFGGFDLKSNWSRGNLVTGRIVVFGQDGRLGFIHPIFNKDVQIFKALKSALFGRGIITFNIRTISNGISFLMKFFFTMLVHRKLYVDGYYNLRLDIEQNSVNNNFVSLSDETDIYGQKGILVNWNVSESDLQIIAEMAGEFENYLFRNNIAFKRLVSQNEDLTIKVEDTYHPTGILSVGVDSNSVLDMNCLVRNTSNLYHFSTGIFPSAKSINPTGAGFCMIEKHLQYVTKIILKK